MPAFVLILQLILDAESGPLGVSRSLGRWLPGAPSPRGVVGLTRGPIVG